MQANEVIRPVLYPASPRGAKVPSNKTLMRGPRHGSGEEVRPCSEKVWAAVSRVPMRSAIFARQASKRIRTHLAASAPRRTLRATALAATLATRKPVVQACRSYEISFCNALDRDNIFARKSGRNDRRSPRQENACAPRVSVGQSDDGVLPPSSWRVCRSSTRRLPRRVVLSVLFKGSLRNAVSCATLQIDYVEVEC